MILCKRSYFFKQYNNGNGNFKLEIIHSKSHFTRNHLASFSPIFLSSYLHIYIYRERERERKREREIIVKQSFRESNFEPWFLLITIPIHFPYSHVVMYECESWTIKKAA